MRILTMIEQSKHLGIPRMPSSPSLDDHRRREAYALLMGPRPLQSLLIIGCDGDPAEAPAPQARGTDQFRLDLYLLGGGLLRGPGLRQRFAAGDVVLHRPGVDLEVVHDPEPRYAKIYFALSPDQGNALITLGLLDSQRMCWTCAQPDEARRLHSDLRRECRNGRKPHGKQAVLRLVAWLEMLQAPAATRDALDQSAQALGADQRGMLDLRQLARRHGLTYATFRRQFRLRFACAPAAWRQRARMERAASLLITYSVQDTAELLAYASPFAFSTQFRRAHGLSPTAFQQRLRG